jgi:uncharacterized protein DUF1206
MARSLVDPIARLGFVARGVLYVVVGILAARAAIGTGGRTTDARGAVREIGRFDTTGILLLLLALGLACYSTWRFVQTWRDLDDKGSGPKGLAVRAGYAASGLGHLGLALTAGGFGVSRGGIRVWAAQAMTELGAWAVGIAGAVVIGVGVWQFVNAWKAGFEEHLRTHRMTATAQRWARRIGRFGLSARGVTFLIIGWFLVQAARHVNAREVRDVGGALRALQQQEYGAWLLGVVALGLVSYGLLSFVDARYRRIVR